MSVLRTITLTDATIMGKTLYQLNISTKKEQLSVQEIISQRVILEVDNYNNKMTQKENNYDLITPKKEEQILNKGVRNRRKINKEKQIQRALDAFNQNGFFILINDLQAESLDQQVTISDNLLINFVKLTPLVGG